MLVETYKESLLKIHFLLKYASPVCQLGQVINLAKSSAIIILGELSAPVRHWTRST